MTADEIATLEKFKSNSNEKFEICENQTREKCMTVNIG
jgi:hypothetical protein